MPGTLQRIDGSMKMERTAGDKGWKLELEVVAYDSGMIMVDGIPINDKKTGYDPADGWCGAFEIVAQTIHRFQQRVARAKTDELAPVVNE
jgi:hypothetical protein